MPTKPKNLVESFMAGLMQDAKGAVDSVTKIAEPAPNAKRTIIPLTPSKENTEVNKDQDQISIVSGSDQDQIIINKVSDKEQVRSRYVSDKDQVEVSPKDQYQITTRERPVRSTKGSPSTSLSKSQTMVLFWFQQRGQTGVFNKPEIERDLSMPYITIRKAINKLENVGVLRLKYDTCQKIYEYEIDPNKNIKTSKNISIGSGSYQDQNTIGSGPLISSSSLLNKTTTMQNCESDSEKIISQIMSADPEYQYWHEQHVSSKQVAAWKNEFGLDLQTILNNLCYARWQILNQKQEINKSPANYIYGIMKKNGGMVNKPAGYKNMSQLDLEFFENWRKERQEHQEKIEQIKNDAIQAEIEPKITAILETPDLENEYLSEAIKGIHSEKRKNLIISTIKSGKTLAEGEKTVLKGYLQKVLQEKALKELIF